MKVLWLCNIVLPELAEVFGFRKQYTGGWLSGAWNELQKYDDLDCAVCVPIRNPLRLRDGELRGYKYYSFLTISSESVADDDSQVERFKEILEEYQPDVIHIWGTEYEHSCSMVKAAEACNLINKVVVNIQGLLTFCKKVYEYGIPEEVSIKKIGGKSIRDEHKSFLERSKYEQYILNSVKHVVGRTDWDRASTEQINRNVNYHYCGEILRNSFYSAPKWNLAKCKKHSIFISQASYPIKGFHLILEQIKMLAKKYPDLVVNVAGTDLSQTESGYARYIMGLIKAHGIASHVKFLGSISEEQMVEEYLKANVFLSPSLIENSSNSVCEAMMLGVPVVASFVGGMASLINHGVSGYMYPLSETSLMRYYIENVFDGNVDINNISKAEIEFAETYNNKNDSLRRMVSIYKGIAKD